MRFALVLVVLAVAGCKSLLGIDDLSLASDAGADAPADVDPARCLGGGLISVCPDPEPTMELIVVGPLVIDTDVDPACVAQTTGGIEACVIVRVAIDIAGASNLRVVGKRPLVLVSTTSISVKGTIDASSVIQKPPGAGADSTLCVAGPMAGGTLAGGAGGSFGGLGGKGGNNGSSPGPVATLAHVQGGCPGSRSNGNPPSLGGAGGGAVYLIAKEQIAIDGTINASGAAGDANSGGGFNQNGGGGGGAGGLIGLDAPAISGAGTLFANGGGGGGGSQLIPGQPGSESPSATISGQGGNGNGDGGNGSLGIVLNGQVGRDGNAGGGGGGAAGVIYARGAYGFTGRVSPDPRLQ